MSETKIPSIVVHKGEKEEKYRMYIEDYVISYLKYKAGSMEIAETFFYGIREEGKRAYIIYGAGKDKHISLFDKYDLLGEVGCRLTQAGPFFIIKESDGIYEVKGYDIFYHKNEEMQNYLIDVKQAEQNKEFVEESVRSKKSMPVSPALSATGKASGKTQSWISLQLGAVFVVLVAIVITSTNSYDKMSELNQAAKEVFFAMENQSAQSGAAGEEIVEEGIENGVGNIAASEQETAADMAVSMTDGEGAAAISSTADKTDNSGGGKVTEEADTDKAGETTGTADKDMDTEEGVGTDVDTAASEDETGAAPSEGTEALSRSITRYYEVEKGDTLYKISLKIYGDTSKVGQICSLNQISDPDDIKYGQKLILP